MNDFLRGRHKGSTKRKILKQDKNVEENYAKKKERVR